MECIRDAFGNEEYYSYDALGRTIIKTDRDGYRTGYDYTADGKIRHISYGDGTSVEMGYTALRQLAFVKDWLGETRIERDATGNPTDITDHKGRTVSYEWGSMGERKSITYPDGNKAIYEYDEMLRLQKMCIRRNEGMAGASRASDDIEEIRYKYNETGRISEKLFPEGMRTRWLYDESGRLAELVHEDRHGVLDRYQYEYDSMGNKTAIIKDRRGLREESGRYEYGYDALNRLKSVSKDGHALRSYVYDSFGNRSYLEDYEKGRNTFYVYDVLNRLVLMEEGYSNNALADENLGIAGTALLEELTRTVYTYDNRGNLIREETGGQLVYDYEYGAMNRLTGLWNNKGQEIHYWYNGLGQRTGKNVNGDEEDYLLDLTRNYHNLLGIQIGEREQRFYFDGNVVAMEKSMGRKNIVGIMAFSSLHYYLQDEMGSTLRVNGFGMKGESFLEESDYLTYGYDEFGNNLRKEMDETGVSDVYDKQGVEQPFAYTGYLYDAVSSIYFAQAREYQSKTGRFIAEDVIKGNGVVPKTLNRYGYCWNSPLVWVDNDGKEPNDFFSTFVLPPLMPPTLELPIFSYVDIDEIIDWYADDEKGKELVERYVYGDGTDYIIDNTDESWRNYMMSNETLALQTGYYLNPIGENLQEGESKEVYIEIPIILQDEANNHSGYMLLYGSNEKVGGYQMNGTISKDLNGTVTYDMSYTFNDIMDPNDKYLEDVIGYAGMTILKFYHSDITMNDYNIKITWSDVTVIYEYGDGNEGWLKDMQSIDPDRKISDMNSYLSVAPAYARGYKKTLKSTIEFYQNLRNYFNNHPEYYGCSTG